MADYATLPRRAADSKSASGAMAGTEAAGRTR